MPMEGHPTGLYDADQARAIDHFAINELGIAALSLMTRAGEVATRRLKALWPSARKITVVCGTGNNAGDGYVLAALLHASGYQVRVINLGNVEGLSLEARTCFDALPKSLAVSDSIDDLQNAEVIVDAIFGIDLNRNVDGIFANAIVSINESGRPVLSLDVPSGLNASTGQVMGYAVLASATVSFISAKIGLKTGAGPDCTGHLYLDDLEIPSAAYESTAPTARSLTYELVKSLLRPRLRGGHKGTHGHALIIGGAPGYRGALMLAGEAAARTGAGLVTLVSNANGPELFNAERPEMMFRTLDNVAALDTVLARVSVVAIGPGLGLAGEAMALFSKVLDCKHALVVDADALRLLADEPIQRQNWVLTPHPGEAAYLLGCDVAEIQSNRVAAAKEIQCKYGGSIILKGVGSVVVANDIPEILMHGNPGMGSGGMGDVLTGIIAALIAQGLSCSNATRLAACIHGLAGDLAAKEGERGLLARDLMGHIRRLVN